MNKPIRILQAFVARDGGGLTAYIAQNYRNIDCSLVQFDFLTYDEDELPMEKEFIGRGARFYRVPRPTHIFSFIAALKKIFRDTSYEAVHLNLSYANIVTIALTKICGAKKIIIHSHSTFIDDSRAPMRFMKTIVHKTGRMMLPCLCDYFFACSDLAGKWMFGDRVIGSKSYRIAKNAIDLARYKYDENQRSITRKSLGIADSTLVVGNIGRLCYQKNQEFLIEIFSALSNMREDSALLIAGTGPNEPAVKSLARRLGIGDKILFLGKRDDAASLYQAMDVFVLPSRFEGLPIVGIEAQAAGLPCVMSDAVTSETAITGLVTFLPLDAGPKLWADKIINAANSSRISTEEEMKSAGYDIGTASKAMENFYLSISSS